MNEPGRTTSVDAEGVRFAVSAPDVIFLERLVDGLPRGWEASPSGAHSGIGLRFSIARERDGYRIRGQQGFGRFVNDSELALWMLRRHIRDVVCGHITGAIPLRAAVVAFRGRGILLPAGTLTGTTTLLEALVRAGGEQYADEIALLSADGLVTVYGREPGGKLTRVAVPLGVVAITAYQLGASWSPSPLSAAESVVALMAFAATPGRTAETLTALRRAVEPAIVLSGDRGDADAAAQAILVALNSGAG